MRPVAPRPIRAPAAARPPALPNPRHAAAARVDDYRRHGRFTRGVGRGQRGHARGSRAGAEALARSAACGTARAAASAALPRPTGPCRRRACPVDRCRRRKSSIAVADPAERLSVKSRASQRRARVRARRPRAPSSSRPAAWGRGGGAPGDADKEAARGSAWRLRGRVSRVSSVAPSTGRSQAGTTRPTPRPELPIAPSAARAWRLRRALLFRSSRRLDPQEAVWFGLHVPVAATARVNDGGGGRRRNAIGSFLLTRHRETRASRDLAGCPR